MVPMSSLDMHNIDCGSSDHNEEQNTIPDQIQAQLIEMGITVQELKLDFGQIIEKCAPASPGASKC